MMKLAALTLVLLAITSTAAFGADVKRGSELFAASCAGCHPGGGNTLAPAKPLKGEGFCKKYATDAQLIDVIRHGVPKTAMSGYPKDVLSDAQVNDIVAFIRTLSPAAKPQKVERPQPAKGKAAGQKAGHKAGR